MDQQLGDQARSRYVSQSLKSVLMGATVMVLALGFTAISPMAKSKSATPSAPACINNKVLSAMQLRIAQTELMVAGLSCRQYEQWAGSANTQRYNEFVTRYRPTLLNDAHKVLARYFPTEQKLNDFLTRLANDSSQRSLANMAIFCTQAVKIYDDVLNSAPVELASYSSNLPIASHHGQTACDPTAPGALPQTIEASAPAMAPVTTAAPAPAATGAATPEAKAVGTVVAQNDAGPGGVSSTIGMQPVVEGTMRAAVRKPVTPRLKPPNN